MSTYDRLINGCLLPGFHGTAVPPWVAGLAGVILFPQNLSGGDSVRRLSAQVRAISPDALIAIDEEGGDVTRLHYETGSPYPGNLALGSVDDLDLTGRVATAIAADLVAAGVNYNLAPSFDVNSDPDNPVIGVRSFGSSPGLVGAHGAAFVRAMGEAGVATAAKHFPGHGATVTDPHQDALPVISCDLETLRLRELAPFVSAVEAGVSSLMIAHAMYPALDPENPATLSRRILHDLVRGELGYEGVLLSTATALVPAGEVPGTAVRSFQAGADLLLIGPDDGGQCAAIRAAVTDAVRRGDLEVSALERAASRVAEMRAHATRPSSGLDAARRAVRVEGDVVLRERAVVVELRAPANVVAGEAYWSVADALTRRDLVAHAVRVDEQGPTPDAFLAVDGGHRLVIVVRDAYRIPWQRAWVEKVMAERPDTVLVGVGMPDDATLAGQAHILTLGAGGPNIQAAVEALAGDLP
ncbi:glycoside hydrolase family 3 protein [Nonomuraea sp. NPDC050556]|uniref:glycoside hydrolase family 3 protein n=1 Tax=Nonomuraea sp. NPDC050556 TaxID=3364369 RepID=UPI0037B6BC8A